MMKTGARALYLCYFGLHEPLVQTQVLPYLRELAASGAEMSLITYEPDLTKLWSDGSMGEWRERLRDEGIEWHTLSYHKHPRLLATIYDVIRGALLAASIARRCRIDIFHSRSDVGTAIGVLAKWMTGGRLIFDIRGLLADEYADSGNFKTGGFLYRATKTTERFLLRAADGFVVLTERGKETLFPVGTEGRPIEVIPTCVDRERFADVPEARDAIRAQLGLTNRLVYVYVGVLGGFYLTQELAALLAVARERDRSSFALILTRSSHVEMVRELERAGFSIDDFLVMPASPEDVPRYLLAADVALAMVRPSYARRFASLTKFGEYLAAGLPVIIPAEIGDSDTHIAESRSGVVLRSFDRAGYDDALGVMDDLRRDPNLAQRCRDEARLRYDLEEVGGVRYRRLYEAVLRR